jgi:hypothetical protein
VSQARRPYYVWKWLCLVLAVGLIAGVLARFPATGYAAVPSISVTAQSVKPDFPKKIDFSIEAKSAAAKIVKAALVFDVADSPVKRVVYPQVQAAGDVKIDYRLNTQQEFIPPGLAVTYSWQLEDEAGKRFVTADQSFVYDDTRFHWNSIKQGHISVFWYDGGQDFGQLLMGSAQRTVQRLDKEIGATISKDVKVLVYANNGDFSGALPPNSAEWIGGQAYPQLNLVMLTVAPDSGAEQEIGRMMPHELTHVVFNQATDNPYNGPPSWLDEGLATYMQEQKDDRFPSVLEQAAKDGTLIPIRALNSSFPADPDRAILSYAESGSVVEYLVKNYGRDSLLRLIAVFREGVTYDDAIHEAFGLNFDQLDANWRSSLPYSVRNSDTPAAAAQAQTPVQQPTTPVSPAEPASNAQSLWASVGGLLSGVLGYMICSSVFIAGIAAVVVMFIRRR